MVTTTHDPCGGSWPRLIAAFGGTAPRHDGQREFDLVPGVTVIGSGPQADLWLEELETHHAEIRRDERDEYIFMNPGSGPPGRVDGQPVSQKPLRTGDRIELGDWTLSYFREESPITASLSAGDTAATRFGSGRAAPTRHFS